MNLYDFEDYVEPTITLLRGRSYYRDGRVLSVEQRDSDHYTAFVSGSEIYQVTFTLDDESEVGEMECTCPYDWGEYCKHEVAVLYFLRRMLDDPETEKKKEKEIDMVERPESVELRSLLEEVSKEELLTFLVEYAQTSPALVSALVLAFPSSDDQVNLINLGIEFRGACAHGAEITYYGRDYSWEDENEDAYIWHFTAPFKRKIEELLKMARSALMEGRVRYAGSIASMMVRELSSFDCFTEHIGEDVEASITLITSLFDDFVPSLEDGRWLFAQFFAEAKNYEYEMQATLLRLCIQFADSMIDQNVLENYLVELASQESEGIFGFNCMIQNSVELRYSLLLKQQRIDDAQAFALENLHYGSLRKLAFDHAMTTKDYPLAERLAVESEWTGRRREGAPDWDELLFRVYQESGDTEKMRTLSRRLLLEGDLAYYPILKATYEDGQWEKVVDGLLDELQNSDRKNWPYTGNPYPEVLKAEKKIGRLLAYVQKSPSLVRYYQGELLPRYQKEVFDLYKGHILKLGETVSERPGYNALAAWFEALVQIGGAHVAKECLVVLEPRYRQRPAMRDELRKVGVL